MLLPLFVTCIFFIQCQQELDSIAPSALPFESVPVASVVTSGTIDEASGIADSKTNPGFIWVQQDSGNPAELFLVNYNGSVQKKIPVKGITNRDWEDIAVGSGPVAGVNYVYIAETGDNNAAYSNYTVYRFPEPASTTDTIFTADKLSFRYPDGSHDAEAMLLDNETRDIYIITKRDTVSRIYKLAFPQSTTTINSATLVGSFAFNGITAAALSPDGKEILVKTYTAVFYWKRNAGESIIAALQRSPVTLGYQLEPQGEAICFKNDNSAFLTLSEKPFFASGVSLNMYKRR